MPTIKDVASAADVSVATVSHVINGTRYVSEELKERVHTAMAELGYRPNTLARSLRSGQSKTIGMIVPDVSNLFFAEIGRAIEDFGFENGYSVILCNSDNNLKKQSSYVDTLITKQVDGVIFISAGDSEEHLASLQQAGVPVVVADRDVPPGSADVVLLNNELGGYLATRHLLELGHRRIACVSGPYDLPSSADRIDGCYAAFDEFGVTLNPDWLLSGDFQSQSGDESMTELLNMPERPTAVFVFNDMMAIGAMNAVRRMGLRIPADVSIVGFDNIALAASVYPPLTTVAQPTQEIATTVCEILFSRIQDKYIEAKHERIVIDPHLVIRSTTQALEGSA
jgi:LacI family transcriptional regulator